MPRLFLLHSAAARDAAARLAARLEVTVEVSVERQETAPGETLIDAWDNGLDASAILLLLDPGLVPDAPTREVWAPVLEHIETRAAPPIAPILAEPCRYPKLLERPPFFRLQEPRPLVEWLHGLHPEWLAPSFAPAPQPHFTGCAAELDQLWVALADAAGTACLTGPAGAGKTALAHEFARQAAGHFRAITWVACGARPPEVIHGELARQLGVPAHAGPDDLRPLLEGILAERRLLVVFDDLRGRAPVTLPPAARASVLITTRDPAPGIALAVRPPRPEPVLDVEARAALALLAQADRNAAPTALVAPESLALLLEARAVDLHDAGRQSVRVLAPAAPPTIEYARAVHRALAGYRTKPATCAWSLPEVWTALECALHHDVDLAAALAERAARFAEQLDRIPEAAHCYRRFIELAPAHPAADHLRQRLAWIAEEDGRLHAPAAPGEQLSLFG